MIMARPSNEEKQRRARESLIQTIAKINDLEPTLGGKWRANMVAYYVNRLAELVLYQSGFNTPTVQAVQVVELSIRNMLELES